jgi:xanthine dehydrogenase accessory factor
MWQSAPSAGVAASNRNAVGKDGFRPRSKAAPEMTGSGAAPFCPRIERMRELLSTIDAWRAEDRGFGRAVLIRVFGNGPRPEGATLLVGDDGSIAGSVSGGCVEGAAAEEVARARRDGCSRVIRFGISDEQAWGVGLACGSTIDVLIEPELRPEIEAAARDSAGAAVVIQLPPDSPGEGGGAHPISTGVPTDVMVIKPAGAAATDELSETARTLVDRRRSGTVTHQGEQYFIETFARPPRIVVFGAVQAAIPLVRMAHELGYRVLVADARAAFASRDRFPHADELLVGWPDEVADQVALSVDDAVVVMSHDPKLDEPAIVAATQARCRYIGAMGSRRTQAGRRERLLAEGLTEEDLARLHGPIGLDLGGREPGEMALAILAEIVAERNDASAAPLSRKR